MKIHWYWPFARAEELAWAVATARGDDEIAVQVIDRPAAPMAGQHGQVTVTRDLPDVDRDAESHLRWAVSRASTYATRARRRHAAWAAGSFDLAHIHYVNRFTDLWLGRHRPPRLVFSVHDVMPHQRRGPARFERALARRLFRSADALIVHHRWLRDQLVHGLGLDAERIHVVGHQVFPVAPELRSDRPPEGPPMILFFGALRPNKGLEVLATALERLPRGLDWRVVIAGRGDSAAESLARQIAAGDDRINAELGFVSYERKATLFRESSVVVLPYTSFSSQSGVLHDAYGHGRPVVVSDVGALGETVREDGTGLVGPPGDAGSLAADVEQLITDAHLWHRTATAAARTAERRSPIRVGTQLRIAYDATAG